MQTFQHTKLGGDIQLPLITKGAQVTLDKNQEDDILISAINHNPNKFLQH